MTDLQLLAGGRLEMAWAFIELAEHDLERAIGGENGSRFGVAAVHLSNAVEMSVESLVYRAAIAKGIMGASFDVATELLDQDGIGWMLLECIGLGASFFQAKTIPARMIRARHLLTVANQAPAVAPVPDCWRPALGALEEAVRLYEVTTWPTDLPDPAFSLPGQPK